MVNIPELFNIRKTFSSIAKCHNTGITIERNLKFDKKGKEMEKFSIPCIIIDDTLGRNIRTCEYKIFIK